MPMAAASTITTPALMSPNALSSVNTVAATPADAWAMISTLRRS